MALLWQTSNILNNVLLKQNLYFIPTHMKQLLKQYSTFHYSNNNNNEKKERGKKLTQIVRLRHQTGFCAKHTYTE